MANLILILADQLTPSLSALEGADRDTDSIVMAEVHSEASYTNHHKKKLILLFSAMRHFASQLKADGYSVHYQRYHPDNTAQSLEQVMAEQIKAHQPERIITTECGEWRLHDIISQWHETLGVTTEIRPDTRFIATKQEFADWAEGRKQLRMEYFYREMRRKTGLLMTPEQKPEGGEWNTMPKTAANGRENRRRPRRSGSNRMPSPKKSSTWLRSTSATILAAATTSILR